MGQCDSITVEPFDCEYGLSELLSPALLDSLTDEFDGWLNIGIVSNTGSIYHGNPCWLDKQVKQAIRDLCTARLDYVAASTDGGMAVVLPLVHELAPIAYIVIRKPGEKDLSELVQFGRFIANIMNRLIYIRYQHRMTSGLHVQVVETSFRDLSEKANQLAQSEKKYRELSLSLEVEVERQTRQIQQAQLMLLQQEKLASVGQLAAGMAHEINNPMGFIISNLNTLKQSVAALSLFVQQFQGKLEEWDTVGEHAVQRTGIGSLRQICRELDIDFLVHDVNQLIHESLEGAQRIKIIIQNLRDFTNPSVDACESVLLNSCIETTLSILAASIPQKVTIVKELGPLPPIRGFLRELNQVFFHILRNALQAVGDSGKIHIRTEAADKQVVIHVFDSGYGIRPEDLSRIFEPFFTTRPVGQGSGLGLNLAYRIIQKHKGVITVESQVGHGAHIRIALPLSGPDRTLPRAPGRHTVGEK